MRYGNAYSYKAGESGTKTVFRYDLPFSEDDEAIFLARAGLRPSDRMGFYQTLAKCIQHEVAVSAFLKENGVPNILTFDAVQQRRDEKAKVTSIFLQAEQVTPILSALFKRSINTVTALGVFVRLATILRDIAKPPCEVTHRGIDLSEVYLNADNRIVLGGFFYAHASALKPYPDYLPEKPPHLPEVFLRGQPGSTGADTQTLAAIMFNLYAGLPLDAVWEHTPRVFPEYATPELAEAIMLGLQCTDGQCSVFRKQLLGCYKSLSKSDAAAVMLPVRNQLRKEFTVAWI